jgi:hypothetical protein
MLYETEGSPGDFRSGWVCGKNQAAKTWTLFMAAWMPSLQ